MKKLTKQQRKIVELLAEGYDNYEIADELRISYRTVKNHISTILEKLNARSRTEVVIMYYQQKIEEMGEKLEG